MARILVIDESQQRAVEMCTGLIKAGHQVAAVLPSAMELIARIEEIKPDIILIETESPSRDTLELAIAKRNLEAYLASLPEALRTANTAAQP